MDVFDFDSSVRNDMEEATDAINRYMGENGIVLANSADSAENPPDTEGTATSESVIQ